MILTSPSTTWPIRVLVSHALFANKDLGTALRVLGDAPVSVFADSGAFTAFTQGQAVDVGAYIAWVIKWGHLLTCAAAPDVIGDPVATVRNTERMQREVGAAHPRLPVLPTYHAGSPFEFLDHWTARVDYLAVGGLVPLSRGSRATLARVLAQVFSRMPAHVSVHGFGMASPTVVTRYPWASADATTWLNGAKYGVICLWNGGDMVRVYDRDARSNLLHANTLRTYGLTVSQATKLTRDERLALTVESYRRLERTVSAVRPKSVYLACGTADLGSIAHFINSVKGATREG